MRLEKIVDRGPIATISGEHLAQAGFLGRRQHLVKQWLDSMLIGRAKFSRLKLMGLSRSAVPKIISGLNALNSAAVGARAAYRCASLATCSIMAFSELATVSPRSLQLDVPKAHLADTVSRVELSLVMANLERHNRCSPLARAEDVGERHPLIFWKRVDSQYPTADHFRLLGGFLALLLSSPT